MPVYGLTTICSRKLIFCSLLIFVLATLIFGSPISETLANYDQEDTQQDAYRVLLPIVAKSSGEFGLPGAPDPFSSVKINFQTASAAPQPGYLVDDGSVYAARSGHTYGWNADNRLNARERNAPNSPGKQYDTLNHMQKDGAFTWEMAVSNGSYRVRVVAGDPLYYDGSYKIEVEGRLAVNGTPASSNPWVEGVVEVNVTDGRLTVSSASGAVNNKLGFIEISSAAAPAPSPGPIPTQEPPVPGDAREWSQDAHDAQRSGYSPIEPLLPWTLQWTWNGPDSQGGTGGHFYDAPKEARTVTGGSYVYVPAGGSGLYALAKSNGSQAWRITDASFNAAPAYDGNTGYLYAGGANGLLYKINTGDGTVEKTYQAGSPLNKSVLLAGSSAYVVSQNGQLHKVDTNEMSRVWVYSAGSDASTPPSYSASKGLIVYATQDLYVHAVDSNSGSRKWRVKPTVHNAGFPYTYEGYWPVIADVHGVVFVRLNLGMDGLWSGPGSGQMYPTSNAETRAYLQSNPHLKNLFALNLDNGSESFIPAVGFGGVEALQNDKPVLDVGPVPVVRVLPDGKEVAYSHFRSGQGNPPDGRWDSHMGEMVLDGSTIPGLASGDLRFIRFSNSYVHITDEQTPLSMAGNTIFHAHWGASESTRITDRSNARGLSHSDPIASQSNPAVIRRMVSCSNFNASTHWTTCGLTLFDDGRFWSGPGWWLYWNVLDPPTPSRRAYSEGILPRYTYVSGDLVIVEGNGGDLFVLKHSGE